MTILFKTLYGSSLYGTTTPNSDKDWKYICLPDIKDAILGKVPKNKVKNPDKAEREKNNKDDVDEEFIPLQVFAKDVMGGQTYALELVYAVDYTGAEQEIFHPKFVAFCHELREQFITSSMKAMVSYSLNQANIYSDKGKRLNAAMAIKRLLLNFQEDVKMIEEWDTVVKAVNEIDQLHPECVCIQDYQINPQDEMRPCINVLSKIIFSTATFGTCLATVDAIIKRYGKRAKAAQADEVDWKATSHALRIIEEGVTILKGEKLVYPCREDRRQRYIAIRLGTIDYDEVMTEINFKLDLLTSLQTTSPLQEQSFALSQRLEDWLYDWLILFYSELNGLSIKEE